MIRFIFLIALPVVLGTLACRNNRVEVPPSPYPLSNDRFTVDTLAGGFVIPYGAAVIGDDEFLITDRVGKLFHYTDGDLEEITGMPQVGSFGIDGIPAILHGGLMDVSLHPGYGSNSLVYLSYLDPGGLARVVRFALRDRQVADLDTLFTTRNLSWTGNGMRIVWQDSSHFFLGVGNSDWSTHDSPAMFAQDMGSDAGKIHRLLEDGSVPPDNPLLGDATAPTTIWSYGHRDVQGLVYDIATQTLLGIEHGPQGGDEFNVIEAGKNYGWPLFTYGINYDGQYASTISEDSAATFTVLPEHYWTVPTNYGGQALAPACLLRVSGSNVPDWNGHFLFGSLAYRRLMKYNRETGETVGTNIEGRVRTLRQLPGGDILALVERNDLTEANGMLLRIGGVRQ